MPAPPPAIRLTAGEAGFFWPCPFTDFADIVKVLQVVCPNSRKRVSAASDYDMYWVLCDSVVSKIVFSHEYRNGQLLFPVRSRIQATLAAGAHVEVENKQRSSTDIETQGLQQLTTHDRSQ